MIRSGSPPKKKRKIEKGSFSKLITQDLRGPFEHCLSFLSNKEITRIGLSGSPFYSIYKVRTNEIGLSLSQDTKKILMLIPGCIACFLQNNSLVGFKKNQRIFEVNVNHIIKCNRCREGQCPDGFSTCSLCYKLEGVEKYCRNCVSKCKNSNCENKRCKHKNCLDRKCNNFLCNIHMKKCNQCKKYTCNQCNNNNTCVSCYVIKKYSICYTCKPRERCKNCSKQRKKEGRNKRRVDDEDDDDDDEDNEERWDEEDEEYVENPWDPVNLLLGV